MPRFVILCHDWPEMHWDFFLEVGERLRAWRLLAEPWPGRVVPCQANHDHRLAYLDYVGPVSGNRGTVQLWDRGNYEGAITGDEWAGQLLGRKLLGEAQIVAGQFFTPPRAGPTQPSSDH